MCSKPSSVRSHRGAGMGGAPPTTANQFNRSIIDLAERSGLVSTHNLASALLTPSARPAVQSWATSHLVPSRIGRRVSAVNRLFRFDPVVETDEGSPPTRARNLSQTVMDSNRISVVTRSSTSSRSQRSQPRARLSILLTPPLQPSSSGHAVSPPPTAILAVLEEKHNHIVQTAMKQDALVRSFRTGKSGIELSYFLFE